MNNLDDSGSQKTGNPIFALLAWVKSANNLVRSRVENLLLWRVWERMLEIEFVDRSVALAGKAFVSFFPLTIVVAAFVPERTRKSIIKAITSRFGISGSTLDTARQAFASSDDIRKATGILGLLLTIFFATSFTVALQRMYLRAWRRPHTKIGGNYIRSVIWLAVMISSLAITGVIGNTIHGSFGVFLFIISSFVVSSAVWWFGAWFMLLGEVKPRVLFPSGVISSLALILYAIAAHFWMPNVVMSNAKQFGFFGVALALVTWFSGASICLIIGTCAGPVFAEDTGLVGRLVRGKTDQVLKAGALQALDAPEQVARLRDSFRLKQDI